ncbi:hypothetical protein OVA07_00295 [Novosphingobium sp. SL115]|uniref:hypothetical protein n=1 Tax=Novosphingobium sp. SL115 TaxID=2995150 RepID=UPI002273114D|nr:hypothetical protein [Novosphingobium sp. SL115]MCY1669463.1 hypothetical protein [Novosphingobium sp. SL115]
MADSKLRFGVPVDLAAPASSVSRDMVRERPRPNIRNAAFQGRTARLVRAIVFNRNSRVVNNTIPAPEYPRQLVGQGSLFPTLSVLISNENNEITILRRVTGVWKI